jgi:hypothetical protein
LSFEELLKISQQPKPNPRVHVAGLNSHGTTNINGHSYPMMSHNSQYNHIGYQAPIMQQAPIMHQAVHSQIRHYPGHQIPFNNTNHMSQLNSGHLGYQFDQNNVQHFNNSYHNNNNGMMNNHNSFNQHYNQNNLHNLHNLQNNCVNLPVNWSL